MRRTTTMAQSVRVSIDNLEVVKDGDPSGQGELYWYFRADSTKIADRGVSNPRKTASGENIPIGESVTVVKNPGETLVIYGSVSDKDSGADGADETASFHLSYNETTNWGAGPINERISQGTARAAPVYDRAGEAGDQVCTHMRGHPVFMPSKNGLASHQLDSDCWTEFLYVAYQSRALLWHSFSESSSLEAGAHRTLEGVAGTLLLANRFESFVERDGALWSMPIERQSKKDLLRHSPMHESRYVLEPEFRVVIRMPHETAALSIQVFQP
jgi:hypothetical protein